MTPSSLNRETNELMQTRRIAASLPVALCSIHEEKIAGVSFVRHRTLNGPEEVDDLLDGCITERHAGWALHDGFRTIDHDSVGSDGRSVRTVTMRPVLPSTDDALLPELLSTRNRNSHH